MRAASFRSVAAPGIFNWQVRLAPARNSPPSLQNTGNGLTPRPSVCAPGYVAAHVALAALRQTLRQMVEESAKTGAHKRDAPERTPATRN